MIKYTKFYSDLFRFDTSIVRCLGDCFFANTVYVHVYIYKNRPMFHGAIQKNLKKTFLWFTVYMTCRLSDFGQ